MMLHRSISAALCGAGAGAMGLGLAFTIACAAPGVCRTGSDCPSGACLADGSCAPAEDDTGSGDTSMTDASTGGLPSSTDDVGDQGADSGDADGDDDTGGIACAPPNHDGLVERDEVPLEAGLNASFLVAQDVAFDSAGAVIDGERVWDFDVELRGDHLSVSETLELDGRWFQPLFPGASHAARLSDADTLLGVFEVTDVALLLVGVVSPDDGPTRTELVYDPPVVALSFPLWEGQSWTSESTITGLAQGIAAFYTERYDAVVDAAGAGLTPYGELSVLRVNILLTRTLGAVPITSRSQLFVAECFGTVASLRSPDQHSEPELTHVAEIRRLAR